MSLLWRFHATLACSASLSMRVWVRFIAQCRSRRPESERQNPRRSCWSWAVYLGAARDLLYESVRRLGAWSGGGGVQIAACGNLKVAFTAWINKSCFHGVDQRRPSTKALNVGLWQSLVGVQLVGSGVRQAQQPAPRAVDVDGFAAAQQRVVHGA